MVRFGPRRVKALKRVDGGGTAEGGVQGGPPHAATSVYTAGTPEMPSGNIRNIRLPPNRGGMDTLRPPPLPCGKGRTVASASSTTTSAGARLFVPVAAFARTFHEAEQGTVEPQFPSSVQFDHLA